MKKLRLLVGMSLSVCLIGLLLFTTVFNNQQADMQQNNVWSTKQSTGTKAEATISQPSHNTYATSNKGMNKAISAQNSEVEVKQTKVENTAEDNMIPGKGKDTTAGIGAIAPNKVAASSDLEEYDEKNITYAKTIDELQSAHPYADYMDHMWVYQQAGAPALSVTFSDKTYTESYDYISIYDKNNKRIGRYNAGQLQGKTISVWDDTIKIRLTSDSSETYYGFAVTDVSIANGLEETYVDYQELPTTWYIGDSKNQTLHYVKKYIQNGAVKTIDLTSTVRFVWNADKDTDAMDIKIDQTKLSISAKKAGNESGYLEVYEANSDKLISKSEHYSFEVKPLVYVDGYANEPIYVNQSSQRRIGNVYVRGIKVSPIITSVTSSASDTIAYLPSGALNGSEYRIKGIKPGTANIIVEYTVMDGTKTVNASCTIAITCKAGDYDGSYSFGTIKPSELLVTQTAEITVSANMDYYDVYGSMQYNEPVDISGFTIEAAPEDGKESLVTTSVEEDKVKIRAEAPGSGEVCITIKKDGNVVCRKRIAFTIEGECYRLEYNGPTNLYYNQIVSGPVLYHYTYPEGVLDKQPVEDAIITCNSNNAVTYESKQITASSEYKESDVAFTCNYEDNTYSIEEYFVVSTAEINKPDRFYKGDSVILSLKQAPTTGDGCTVEWTVKNEYSYVSTALASIQTNQDGTATLSCKEKGYIIVTAIIKKGKVELCTSEFHLEIREPSNGVVSSISETKKVKVNQPAYLSGSDYRVNDTYYKTSITGVKSSDESIVEILDNEYYPGSRNRYFNYKGKKIGKATITISYTYIDQDGTPVKNEEIVNVEVKEDIYTVVLKDKQYNGAPGVGIALHPMIRREGYDTNGNSTTTYITPSETRYTFYKGSDKATIENDTLTFNADANPGDYVYIYAYATANGKEYKTSWWEEFTVVTNYYKLNGIDKGRIYIKEGDTKTLTAEIDLYNKDNLSGKKVENVVYGWTNNYYGDSYNPKFTDTYITCDGLSITGSKGGQSEMYMRASYLDANGSEQYEYRCITVSVIPKEVPALAIGQRGEVSFPCNYFKVTPTTTGTYKIMCSDEMSTPEIILLDQNFNEISTYTISDSAYKGYLSVSVTLKAGVTYNICAESTEELRFESFNPYVIVIQSGIVEKNIDQCQVTWSANRFTYNGNLQKPTVTIKDGTKILKEGTDYLLQYTGEMTKAGSYYIELNGKGNYCGSIKQTILIQPIVLTDDMLQPSKMQVLANGEAQKPSLVVKNGEKTLIPGTDYTISYKGDFTEVGEYLITMTGTGNYQGAITKTFEIKNKLDLSKCTVKLSKESFTYNGGVQKPDVTVLNGTTELTKGTDYNITYPEGMTNVKSYTITLTGKGDYDGNVEKNYQITPYSVASLTVSLSATNRTYNKSTIKPTVTVKNGNKVLVVNTDYTVTYVGTFQNPGIYKVTVTGKGNYSGSKTLIYTINKLASTVAFNQKSVTKKYGDKPFTLALTTKSKKPVTYTSSNGNVVKVDKYGKVTIVGAGKAIVTAIYAGDTFYNGAKATCTITVAKINNSITASNVVKTASSKAQSFSIKVLTKGKTTLGYTSSNKAVTVKAGKVTITKDFVGKVTITVKAASTTNYNAASKSITITVNPAATKITSLKKQSKNKFLLKWSKNSKASGYEIQYATSKSFKSAVTKKITKNSTTSYTASSLKKKKTYYVRVRTYKTVGKVKFYSGWSTIKSVKN